MREMIEEGVFSFYDSPKILPKTFNHPRGPAVLKFSAVPSRVDQR